jgi:hypothetical protein
MTKIGNVPESFLTHVFSFNGKECLIGKFDPEAPDSLIDLPFEKMGTELLDQINRSEVFTLDEMENIAMMHSADFIRSIREVQ